MNIAESEARRRVFSRLEAEVLPAAARRADAIAPLTICDITFGSRPTAKAFGEGGELRFEIGRWDGDRFVPFGDRILFPHPPPEFDVTYPKDAPLMWRNVSKHYTPVTRRLDYFEVWDYFSAKRFRDEAVREKALGLLASRLAASLPAEKVSISCRYIRYAEQYVSVTCVESRDLAAAGRDEYLAIRRLTA